MDRKLFERIKKGVKATQGSQVFEAVTGRSTTSVSIARDWLQGLKDIVANKADALNVIRETTKRIDAAVAGGDLSDIYAQIKQQMPDTNDLGLIAANMQSIEQWLNRESTPPTKKGESLNESTEEQAVEEQVTDEFVGAIASGIGGAIGGVAKGVGKAVKGVADGAANVVQGAGNVAGSAVGAAKNTVKAAVESYSVTNISKPPKINASGDANSIEKTTVNYTDDAALDVLNKNPKGTVANDVVEDLEEGYVEVEANEIFILEEEDVPVYFDESGELYYATEQDMYEAGYDVDEEGNWFINEDVVINVNSDGTPNGKDAVAEPAVQSPEAQGGATPPPEVAPQGAPPPEAQGAVPPPESGTPAPDQAAPPTSPMEVELVNNGTSGEVNKVIINANGKRIVIGPDGQVVEEQLQSESQDTEQSTKKTYEGLSAKASSILNFFYENNVDVKGLRPASNIRTGAGGVINATNVDYTDADALNPLNSGGDINGKKKIKEDYNEGEGDYDNITVARGLGKSIRSPKGELHTTKFEGEEVSEEGMVDSGYKLKGSNIASDPSTPKSMYNQQVSDWRGTDVSAKARVKPDQSPEPGRRSESIKNISTFRAMSRGLYEGYQVQQDLADESGEITEGKSRRDMIERGAADRFAREQARAKGRIAKQTLSDKSTSPQPRTSLFNQGRVRSR